MKNWSIYIVECIDDTLYTGISTDVLKRVFLHNSGKGAKYTRSRRPVKLLIAALVGNRSEASKLESKVKSLKKDEKVLFVESFDRQSRSCSCKSLQNV